MNYVIKHETFDGQEKRVYFGTSLDEAIGYMCAISVPDLHRRNVRHSMTHPSFKTHSFTASAPDRGMYRMEVE